MRTIQDIVIIKADPEKNFTKSLGKNPEGEEIKIFIDPIFNPHSTENTCQDGIVMAIPEKFSKDYRKEYDECELKPGQRVYTHHFLGDMDQAILWNGEGNCFRLLYEQVYCIVEGKKIRMIANWNFLTPIEEKDDRGLIPEHLKINRSTTTGIAEHISDKLKLIGVKKGDKVIYKKNMDYEMIVEGVKYLRILTDDICGIIIE